MPSLMHARALRARIRRAGTVDAKPDVRLGHPNRFQHVLMKYFPLIAVIAFLGVAGLISFIHVRHHHHKTSKTVKTSDATAGYQTRHKQPESLEAYSGQPEHEGTSLGRNKGTTESPTRLFREEEQSGLQGKDQQGSRSQNKTTDKEEELQESQEGDVDENIAQESQRSDGNHNEVEALVNQSTSLEGADGDVPSSVDSTTPVFSGYQDKPIVVGKTYKHWIFHSNGTRWQVLIWRSSFSLASPNDFKPFALV
eukprot:1175530-Prorocentrum_minimum.AAC.5